MTLQSIFIFLFFTLLSVYFSFLNPHEVEIHFSQAHSLRLPMIVLFLGSVLLGLLVAGFLHGTLSLRSFFSNLRVAGRNKLQNKTNRRIGTLFEEAENLVASGRISKAISFYEKILDLSPNHITVLIRLGNRLREEGNIDRALELHTKAVRSASNNLDALYSLADDYSVKAGYSFEMCQMEMATLEKIEKLDQKSPRVFYRMREIHLKSEDWVLVADVQKKLISRIEGREKKAKEKKKLSRYIYNNGVRYFNNDNFEAAICEFKKALREHAQCLSANILLGDSFIKTGNEKAALKVWEKGYENTNSPVCLIRIEKFYRESDRVGEMVKVYKDAIKKSQNSNLEILNLLLGNLYLEEGNFQETIQIIQKNTASQQAIIPSLILADAYKRQQDQSNYQKAVENAFSHVKSALFNFKCGGCGETLDEWIDSCPNCNTFDKIECYPRI